MEEFRLRVKNEPKRGQFWELHMFPAQPRRLYREADGRLLGSTATPSAIHWLRQTAEPMLLRAERPGPISAPDFGPASEPRWLVPADGMRLGLAFSAARWLVTPRQRQRFLEGLRSLPSEVVLYWFTLCFYGYQQAAGRAALRTLLTHEEPEPRTAPAGDIQDTRPPKRDPEPYRLPESKVEERSRMVREALEEFSVKAIDAGKEQGKKSSKQGKSVKKSRKVK
jgi:hypothetical protein